MNNHGNSLSNSIESNEKALDNIANENDKSASSSESEIIKETSSDEEDIEWSDVDIETASRSKTVELVLNPTAKKRKKRKTKESSKPVKSARYLLTCHTFHLDCLIAHSIIRNHWINDTSLQKQLKSKVPESLRKEIKKYHRRLRNGSLQNKSYALSLIDILSQLAKIFKRSWKVIGHPLRVTNQSKSEISTNPLPFEESKKKCLLYQGNEDLASQVFVGILRASGFKTRLVFSPPVINYHAKTRNKRSNLHLYPNYWAEVYDGINDRYIAVDPMILPRSVYTEIRLDQFFEPKGNEAGSMKMYYVLGIDHECKLIDLTSRYMSLEKISRILAGSRNKNKPLAYSHFRQCIRSNESSDILKSEKILFSNWNKQAGLPAIYPNKISYYVNHDYLILKSRLPSSQTLTRDSIPVHTFEFNRKVEQVYMRSDLRICRSETAWLKDGREILSGEKPAKITDVRLNTNPAKRQKHLQQRNKEISQFCRKLYTFEQSKRYTPGKVIDGQIPLAENHNAVLLFKPDMIPDGASHLTYPGIEKIATELNINHAAALVDFKFRKNNAIPIFHGIIVPTESREILVDKWNYAFRQKIERQTQIRKLSALKRWKSYHQKLRIVQRLNRYDRR